MEKNEPASRANVRKVAISFLLMFFYSIAIALLAAITANLIVVYSSPSHFLIRMLETLGYICWGTSLGARGTDILTWGGTSPAEIFNQRFVISISMIGIFVFVLAQRLAIAVYS